jgi:hypothetical protein
MIKEPEKQNTIIKVHWYCSFFVGCLKWQSTEVYEPDECDTAFTTVALLNDWEDETVEAVCPRCKNILYQAYNHPEKEYYNMDNITLNLPTCYVKITVEKLVTTACLIGNDQTIICGGKGSTHLDALLEIEQDLDNLDMREYLAELSPIISLFTARG